MHRAMNLWGMKDVWRTKYVRENGGGGIPSVTTMTLTIRQVLLEYLSFII